MSTHVSMRATNGLVPSGLLQQIQTGNEAVEKTMATTAKFVLNLIKSTIYCLNQHKIRDLDANPGDRQCQLRAMILRTLTTDPDIVQETLSLAQVTKTALKLLHKRHQTKRHFSLTPVPTFFENQVSSIVLVSRKFLYLVNCRLLTLTKVKNYVDESGIIVTKTSISPLTKLTQGIKNLSKEERELILGMAAARLSAESLHFYQEMCRTTSPITSRMMQQVRQGKPYKDHPLKLFGCQFYEIKAVLMHLKAERAVIAVKTVVKEGNPSLFVFQPSQEHGEFAPMENELPPEIRIVIFEGIVRQGFLEKVQEVGLSRIILACSAQEEPFEHGSTLDMVTDLEARSEIEACQKDAEKVGCKKGQDPLFLLDHVFCNSLQEEKI